MAAAGDEVSLAIAAYFSQHGEDFQALSAKADAFHQQFEQALKGGGNSYAATEAANASPLQSAPLQSVLGAPAQTPSNRSLIGSRADGTVPRVGGAGGALLGSGGPAGLLVPAAGAGGGKGAGSGPDETTTRRSFGPPGAPLAAARDSSAAGRDATRAPEPQHSDRTGHGVDGPMTITRADSAGPTNGAERAVWQALLEQLLPNDLVIVGQRVTDHLKDHEIDFTVAIEG